MADPVRENARLKRAAAVEQARAAVQAAGLPPIEAIVGLVATIPPEEMPARAVALKAELDAHQGSSPAAVSSSAGAAGEPTPPASEPSDPEAGLEAPEGPPAPPAVPEIEFPEPADLDLLRQVEMANHEGARPPEPPSEQPVDKLSEKIRGTESMQDLISLQERARR